MDAEIARKVLHHALALHVLEPEDIQSVDVSPDDAAALLEQVERRHLLSAAVVDALDQLVEVQTGTRSPETQATETDQEDAPGLDLGAATMEPSEGGGGSDLDLNLGSATMEPGEGGGGLAGFDLGAATMEPAEGTEDLPFDISAATMEPGTGRHGAGGLELGLGSATAAPDDGPAESGLAVDLGAATMPPSEDGVDEDLTDISAPTAPTFGSLDDATMPPEDGTAPPEGDGTAPPEGDTGAPQSGGYLGDPDDATIAPDAKSTSESKPRRQLDLSRLSEDARQRIEEMALLRKTLKRGLESREKLLQVLETAYELEKSFQAMLVAEGVLDLDQAEAIAAEIAVSRPVCPSCLNTLPKDHPDDRPCIHCKATTKTTGSWNTGGSTSWDTHSTGASRADTGSDSWGTGTGPPRRRKRRGRDRGIEGFPGEGGTFASYELIERVAEGGMGVVFKARETSLNRIVALKVMRGGALSSKNRRRRFLREAESAAALHHPNIVPIHQISEVAGYPFYTMDFVEGLTFDEYVKQNKCEPREMAQLMQVVAEAVHHFHLRGIIHRDLKPDNILVTKDGVPKIIDFGIAKKISSDFDSDANWTVDGDVFGTPHYMPPEQAGGRVNEVEARSDVYSLGAILYEVLTGNPPFHGVPMARLTVAVQEDDPKPIRPQNQLVERDLEAITEKAMSKERERRYQSSLEFSHDLERYVSYKPVIARPATIIYRTRKWVRRRLPYVIAGSVLVAAASVALGIMAFNAVELNRKVAALVDEADSDALTIEQRSDMLKEALVLDPDNRAAKAKVQALDNVRELEQAKEKRLVEIRIADERRKSEIALAEQKRKEELQLAEERRKRDLAQAELAKERAEAAERAVREREQARKDAEEQSRRKAQQRAIALLKQAGSAKTPLAATGLLTDALVLLPPGSGDVRTQVERAKVATALTLSDEALAKNQAGLVGFWLREATKLEAAKERHADTKRLQEALHALESGQQLHTEGKALLRLGKWVAARDKLAQAKASGVSAALIDPDLTLAQRRCEESAQRLIDETRTLLQEGRASASLARAREATRFVNEGATRSMADSLVEECAAQVAYEARVKAHELSQRPEGRRRALAVLEEGERALSGTGAVGALKRERAQRTRLLEDPSLKAFVYVPRVDALDVDPFYITAKEVTNAEFKVFVDAGGYSNQSLWVKRVRGHLKAFHDSTPGEKRQPGPRTWRHGSYGDVANADRPVTGITYYEALAYARWLDVTTGKAWRLPSAAEWEVAAGWDPVQRRMRTYPWGERPPRELLLPSTLPHRGGQAPEDRSALGLFDAGGNVCEWVVRGKRPALKGGSFSSDPVVLMHLAKVSVSGTPKSVPPSTLLASVGFRVVRECEGAK